MPNVIPLQLKDTQPQTVAILGATGTIGKNTLSVMEHANGAFTTTALTAADNVELLIAQARIWKPELAVIANPAHYAALKNALAGTGIETAAGEDAVTEAAARKSDIVVSGIVGAAGLKPTLVAAERGARIALANKECLVIAGTLLQAAAKASGALLIPVDSEHNAIFQILQADTKNALQSVTLTASGGPFRGWTKERMQKATPEEAINHPNWRMGAKISVDSATLMNKALELIEAQHLFNLREEQLRVLIHPQSIVHALVEYADGSVLAQLSTPDMRTPIAHALAWPNRISTEVRQLNLAKIGTLSFDAPDEVRFPAMRVVREVLKTGGSAPIIFNAANEVAVEAFLKNRIGFLSIVEHVEAVLSTTSSHRTETLEDIMACDADARRKTISLIQV